MPTTPEVAMPNYIADVCERITAARAETGRAPLDPDLLRLYALLVLTTGTATENCHVHDAWSVWAEPIKPDAPSLIPFDQLDTAEQERDSRHRDLIRAVAAGLQG